MATIIMPILLDLSNNTAAEVMGESYSVETSEPFTFHLKWDLSGVQASDLSGILYGDSDTTTGNLFWQRNSSHTSYSSTDVSGVQSFVDGLLFPMLSSITNSSNKGLTNTYAATKAVPLVTNDTSGNTFTSDSTKYTNSLTGGATDRQSIGGALLRVMSTHLMGHPLGQTFVTNDTIFSNSCDAAVKDLCSNFIKDLSGAADGNGASTAMEGCDTDASGGRGAIVDKSSGGSNAVLKSMLEQLFASASGKDRFINQETDVSGFSGTKTRPQPMTFQAGDTIVFYVRVKTALTVETAVLGQYSGLDASGVFNRDGQRETFDASSAAATVGNVSSVFPGGVGSALYGWMGGGYQHSRTFSQTDTDISDANVFDAHVWRISATLN